MNHSEAIERYVELVRRCGDMPPAMLKPAVEELGNKLLEGGVGLKALGQLHEAGVEIALVGCEPSLVPEIARQAARVQTMVLSTYEMPDRDSPERCGCVGEALSMSGEILRYVCHDVNNQLGAVVGYADLMREGNTGTDDRPIDKVVGRRVDRILNASQRSSMLMTTLLSFLRRGRENSRQVDARRICDDIAVMLDVVYRNRMTIVHPDTVAPHLVTGDAAQIQNALLELCLCAGSRLRGQGKFTIELYHDQSNGRLPAAVQFLRPPGVIVSFKVRTKSPREKDPADRRCQSLEREAGYANAEELIDGAGGCVEILSYQPDAVEINVWLPAAKIQNEIPVCAKNTAGDNGRPPGTVLVVDDEEIMADMMTQMLELHGYT
ncbi:MAG: hypothetical protein GF344_16250, partial [Chitinivibrionales bacterium]|nr:hypothetical protein [Chitinivibrionales bacterium]MBD3358248.1 hypothetical protein [Chitinivibrionales bacterium]